MRCFFAALLICFSVAAFAEPPVELDLVPTRVAMFKNGYGIVTAEAALPDAAGPVRLAPLPAASLGSFWLRWPEGVSIDGVASRYAQRTQPLPAASFGELLLANVGQPIEVLVGEEWLAGTILDLPRPTPDVSPADAFNSRGNLNTSVFPPPTSEPRIVLLALGDTTQAIPINSIRQLRLPKNPALSFDRTTQEPVLEMRVGGKPQGDGPATLGVEYTAVGITWSPSYQVDISDSENARISAKAVIINDLLDLQNTDVELITGYPHLPYAGLTYGLSLNPLTRFLAGFRSNDRGSDSHFALTQSLSNTAGQQARYGGGFGGEAPSMPTDPVLGESAEDLYFYQLPAVTLAKGERGYFPLFAADVPYQHCYTWDIADFIDADNRYRNQQNDQPREEIVWHAIRLKNTTTQPWTTAPGQTTRGGRLLGQDTLHYTTPGTSTDLKITQALAIRAQQNEQETQRERNATKFYGYNYDKVTIKGELVVTNYKPEAVTVSIRKLLSGEVFESDADPKITKLATGLRRVNPRCELLWELDVEPGKDAGQTITYTYEVYVRN